MANITQVEVNGTTYDICDATARDSLSQKVGIDTARVSNAWVYTDYDGENRVVLSVANGNAGHYGLMAGDSFLQLYNYNTSQNKWRFPMVVESGNDCRNIISLNTGAFSGLQIGNGKRIGNMLGVNFALEVPQERTEGRVLLGTVAQGYRPAIFTSVLISKTGPSGYIPFDVDASTGEINFHTATVLPNNKLESGAQIGFRANGMID